MMAGTGVNISGVGMLRTRRKDISIKPNRRLDRKSSRGMIYENEELRLRTIHINAAIEQGQNDIKKLRKENEQLRREIWCLRDEYDKLEEILRKQKCHEGSDECESRSEENEASQLSYSERDEEEYNNDMYDDVEADNDNNGDSENVCNNDDNEEKNDSDDEDDYDDEDTCVDNDNNDEKSHGNKESRKETSKNINGLDQDDLLKSSEIQKFSLEKKSDNLDYLHVDFDGLSVVDEEEEQKKVKIKHESDLIDTNESNIFSVNSKQTSFSSKPIFSHCPFIFPKVDNALSSATDPTVFNSASTLKLDTPVAELNNSTISRLSKTLGNLENHSESKLYLDTSKLFARRRQKNHQPTVTFAPQVDENFKYNLTPSNSLSRNVFEEKLSLSQTPLIDFNDGVENFETMKIFNPEEIDTLTGSIGQTPSSSNTRPKQIFAPLSSESQRFLLTRQSLRNETIDNKNNDKTVSNTVILDNFCNKSACRTKFSSTEKQKSVSLDTLHTNKNQNFSECSSMNSFKLFSSCHNLNAGLQNPSFLEEMKSLTDNSYNERYVECNNSKNNYDPSKPFKSQLSVVLKSPRQGNVIAKEIPQFSERASKHCSSLNNLCFKNAELSRPNRGIEQQMISSAPINDYSVNNHGYQATSFEGPYPITLQIPSMMPVEFDYKNVPFLQRRAFYYPGDEMKIFYDSIPHKISAHTQTLEEDIPPDSSRSRKDLKVKTESAAKESLLNHCRKKTTKKEKTPCGGDKKSASSVNRRKRDVLKKQVSVSSCDDSESANLITGTNFEAGENKHESRSSSSDVDSHRKEQTHRVSVYFNSKKRPSLTSMKSTRNTNMDNSRSRIIPQKDHSDGNTTNLGAEHTNSVHNKEVGNSKKRKTSTSSENVPWCACWGNGCI